MASRALAIAASTRLPFPHGGRRRAIGRTAAASRGAAAVRLRQLPPPKRVVATKLSFADRCAAPLGLVRQSLPVERGNAARAIARRRQLPSRRARRASAATPACCPAMARPRSNRGSGASGPPKFIRVRMRVVVGVASTQWSKTRCMPRKRDSVRKYDGGSAAAILTVATGRPLRFVLDGRPGGERARETRPLEVRDPARPGHAPRSRSATPSPVAAVVSTLSSTCHMVRPPSPLRIPLGSVRVPLALRPPAADARGPTATGAWSPMLRSPSRGRPRARHRLRPARRRLVRRALRQRRRRRRRDGWRAIAAGRDTLIAAPDGLRQDARRLPLGDRPAGPDGADGLARPTRPPSSTSRR